MTEPNKVGIINSDGHPEYPDVTVSGREYIVNGCSMRMIGDGKFIILDPDPAQGFDLDAEISKLVVPKSATAKVKAEALKE